MSNCVLVFSRADKMAGDQDEARRRHPFSASRRGPPTRGCVFCQWSQDAWVPARTLPTGQPLPGPCRVPSGHAVTCSCSDGPVTPPHRQTRKPWPPEGLPLAAGCQNLNPGPLAPHADLGFWPLASWAGLRLWSPSRLAPGDGHL